MSDFYNINELTDQQDFQTLIDGLNAYNTEKCPDRFEEINQKIHLVVKNENEEVIGGLLSSLGYFKGLEIYILWIKEGYRKNNLGSLLLTEAENRARELGGYKVMLDTFSFQAKDFYLKNGYKIIGEMKDFPKGHTKTYFYKDL